LSEEGGKMALIGIDKDEIFEYISNFDKNKNNPTIFELGVLDNRTKLNLLKDAVDSRGEINISALQSKSYEIVKAGLKKIRNLYNKKTKQYEDIKNITDEVLDKLPMVVITELAGKIIEINFLSQEEEKN